MIRVQFVCLGNICRSPMADAVFQDLVRQAGLEESIQVDSAGTGRWHVGELAHVGTRKVLQKHAIPYDGRARQFIADDAKTFDYIYAMDASNLQDIRRLVGNHGDAHIELFLQTAYDQGIVGKLEVPDPYYDNRFDEVYDLVHKGAEAILNTIREQHNL
jgi:protein-tyrosine phosphatase